MNMKKKLNDICFVLSQKFGYDISYRIVSFFYKNRLKSSLYSHILSRFAYSLFKSNSFLLESYNLKSKICLYNPDCIPLDILKILQKLKKYDLIDRIISFHIIEWLWHYRFFHSKLCFFEESHLNSIYNILIC